MFDPFGIASREALRDSSSGRVVKILFDKLLGDVERDAGSEVTRSDASVMNDDAPSLVGIVEEEVVSLS